MRILAGGRGSGKTYELFHLAAADPEGIVVARDHRMVRYFMSEYWELIPKDRIISYSQIPGSDKEVLRLYVDDFRHGEEIPPHWYRHHDLVAITMTAKDTYENSNLSPAFKKAIRQMYEDTELDGAV